MGEGPRAAEEQVHTVTYLQHGLDGERGVPDLGAVGALHAEGGPLAARAGSSRSHSPRELRAPTKRWGPG